MLVFTEGGYVKRTDPSEYRAQKRGGVGVVDLETKEEDFVTILLNANTHDELLFFTNLGKAYQIKMYDLPEGRRATRGKSIMNFLSLAEGERVMSILPVSKTEKGKEQYIFLMTENGTGKKMSAKHFADVRRSGIISITLDKDDSLRGANLVQKGDDVMLATAKGQSVRFKESDIREMGRTAGGVRAMKLGKGDSVVGFDIVKKETRDTAMVLVMSANGLGKKTAMKEYKVQKRGGSGIKTAKVTPKTGDLIMAKVITDEVELIAMSQKGQVIRTALESVSALGRQTQGVSIMKLRAGDKVASITCL